MRRVLAIAAALVVVAASAAGAYAITRAEPGFGSASAPSTATIVQPRGQRPALMRTIVGTSTTPLATSPVTSTP